MSINPPANTETPVDQVPQGVITETPPTQVEENSNPATGIENVSDDNNGDEVPPADSNETPPVEQPAPTEPKLSAEQLEQKLKEYQLKEQEAIDLRARLGVEREDDSNYHLDTIEATIDNRAQQAFIKLCNTYGVDYTPEGIDKSTAELLEKNPKMYYEFKHEGEKLYNKVNADMQDIRSTRISHGIESFVLQNKPILENSPVVQKIVGDYIQQNYSQLKNPQQELNSLMDVIKDVYSEAIEVGKHMASIKEIANDKSGVSGGIATANTSAYPMNDGVKAFTRSQIKAMDTKTFKANEALIMKQMQEGRITD